MTQSHIEGLLEGVNVVFRQAGMHFSLGTNILSVVNERWGYEGLTVPSTGTQIRNLMSGTGGLEVYFITGCGDDDEPLGSYNSSGIIVKKSADVIILAHEIGHACGWPDVYVKRGSNVPVSLGGSPRSSWMSSDWSNGTGCRFYHSLLSQRDIIRRLLMHGVRTEGQSDIPSGSVFGLARDGETGMLNVGRNGNDFFVVSPKSN